MCVREEREREECQRNEKKVDMNNKSVMICWDQDQMAF